MIISTATATATAARPSSADGSRDLVSIAKSLAAEFAATAVERERSRRLPTAQIQRMKHWI